MTRSELIADLSARFRQLQSKDTALSVSLILDAITDSLANGDFGYEIPFNRHFYVFQPPRPLAEIDAELKAVTDRIKLMIEGLSA